MDKEKSSMGVAALYNFLYVLGGYDGVRWLNEVECYSIEDDTWTSANSMHFCRDDPGVAVLNGKIYVVGGFDQGSSLDSVEYYDPHTDEWTQVNFIKIFICRYFKRFYF